MDAKKYLNTLFERPNEPLIIPKGKKRRNFIIPNKYLPDTYNPTAYNMNDTTFYAKTNTLVVPNDIEIPDMTIPKSHPRNGGFSLFIPSHREKADYLTKIFLDQKTTNDLVYVAASCRDSLNPEMYHYALSTAMMHRTDTKDIEVPLISEIFPAKFLDNSVLYQAKEQASFADENLRKVVEIGLNHTATDKDPEHKVAYFREDIGINLHHWHWHLVYPYGTIESVVNKDRRGELFYYMHHQIMSRFNIERLCNNLARVKPLNDLHQPLAEAYFPKLDQASAGRTWPARPANMKFSDLNRTNDQVKVSITDIERYKKNILDAIRTKEVRTTDGKIVQLDDKTGIDVLGNMIEASKLSPNPIFYGNIHNMGHDMIAFIHDPDNRYLESFAVMGDPTTALRDPVFYRWHSFIDDVFRQFKDSLPPYTRDKLLFRGISITSVDLVTTQNKTNVIDTYWTKNKIDISRGLDFAPGGAILASVQHLNHFDFSYNIKYNNTNNKAVKATVRIFMAPKYDENKRTLNFNDQRFLMIEMDKFTALLKPGHNNLPIERNSIDSSITIPFESTFRDFETDRPRDEEKRLLAEFSFCGCGWPQHMLCPKGTQEGFPMDLFVMISDYEQDKIDQKDSSGNDCQTGFSFCGLRNSKYPDAQAMGFPFDRMSNVNSMSEFLTPNMMIREIKIRFTDTVVSHPRPSKSRT